MDIKRKVDSLVRKHQTRNPFEIIRGLNVILVFAPLVDTRGFYQYFQRNNIIYINENLPRHEQMLVCAHELGHMFLHKNTNAIFLDSRTHLNTQRYETEANLFAMHLLISDDALQDYPDCTSKQLARMFGYSKELIDLRLEKQKKPYIC